MPRVRLAATALQVLTESPVVPVCQVEMAVEVLRVKLLGVLMDDQAEPVAQATLVMLVLQVMMATMVCQA